MAYNFDGKSERLVTRAAAVCGVAHEQPEPRTIAFADVTIGVAAQRGAGPVTSI